MDEISRLRSVSKSFELTENKAHILLEDKGSAFIIEDLIISNKNANVILQLDDGENRFEILTMDKKERKFNHAFSGGLQSWRNSRLILIKNGGEQEGEEIKSKVTVFINYLTIATSNDYSVWTGRRFG